MKPNFHTQFDHSDPVISFAGEQSLARQEFRDDADINNIIKRYQATGFLIDPSVSRSRQAMFGDFSSVPDAAEFYQRMIQAQADFDSLPIEIRQRFNFDPSALLAFVSDRSNHAEAVRLGLIDAPAEQVRPENSGRSGAVETAPTASASNGMAPESSQQSALPNT